MGKNPALNKELRSLRLDPVYKTLLNDIKGRIKSARLKTAIAANQELIKFYWEVGHLIIDRQKNTSWGDKLMDALSIDLKASFPGTKGFSRTNLHNMRLFATTYSSIEFIQAPPGQLTWTHNIVLITGTKNLKEQEWYAEQALENGWGYKTLQKEIKNNLYHRQAKIDSKTTNFPARLKKTQSDLALQTLKDPYRFDFLSFEDEPHELEIQNGLVSHVRKFLMELGQGFAFYGSKYAIKVSRKHFEIDLLMYHTRLHCYVVIELKKGDFKPKDAGQLNFYLSAVDEQLKLPEDNPSIGLILCESKDRVIAEYALQDVNKPIGISEYTVSKILPKDFENNLPTIEEIESELNDENIRGEK